MPAFRTPFHFTVMHAQHNENTKRLHLCQVNCWIWILMAESNNARISGYSCLSRHDSHLFRVLSIHSSIIRAFRTFTSSFFFCIHSSFPKIPVLHSTAFKSSNLQGTISHPRTENASSSFLTKPASHNHKSTLYSRMKKQTKTGDSQSKPKSNCRRKLPVPSDQEHWSRKRNLSF